MGQKYINNYKCNVHAIPGQWNCISRIGITTNSIIKKRPNLESDFGFLIVAMSTQNVSKIGDNVLRGVEFIISTSAVLS